MKLVLMRDQSRTIIGTAKFALKIAAELTTEESANISKYKMGRLILFSEYIESDPGFWKTIVLLFRKLKGLIFKSTKGLVISINDLVKGKQIVCKDIIEMVSIEDQVKEACQLFKIVLDTAANFGGNEVIEF